MTISEHPSDPDTSDPDTSSAAADAVTQAEERRAAEEALIAQRNRAQHESEADGSEERVLLLPPEGYAVRPSEDG